jgi:tryptophan synthase alpha chain
MGKINDTFETLKTNGQKALVGFISAGDPSVEESLQIIERMCRSGLDILELGVPFSDPTADGPVIQRSSARAIKAGVNMRVVLDMVKRIRAFSSVPVIVFTYYNPILAYGAEAFYRDSVQAGVDGVLVVDLPPEESDELTGRWGDGLDFIRLVAPTTPPRRMAEISAKASGFIYLVSMTGVTGSGGLNREEIAGIAAQLKENCNGLPVCIGFGISTPEQASMLSGLADGIVIGSAFERLIESNIGDGSAAGKVAGLLSSLKGALGTGVS